MPNYLKELRTLRERTTPYGNNHQKHPGLEFKKIYSNKEIYSIRVGIGWRALGSMKSNNTIVWFWIGSHSQYDSILKEL